MAGFGKAAWVFAWPYVSLPADLRWARGERSRVALGPPGGTVEPWGTQVLSIKAYYCAAWGCNTAACRAAAVIIGGELALPGGGTAPVLPILK